MSTRGDIETFVMFLRETFIDQGLSRAVAPAEDGKGDMVCRSRDDNIYLDCDPGVAKEEATG